MKAINLMAITGMMLTGWCRADIIAQWNFNDNARANQIPASSGTGVASLVGGATATFAPGITTDTPDAGATNYGWNTTTYPAQGTGNKTRGVQFAIDTTGFENISLRFDLRGSATASKYSRIQYSLNGIDFIDSGVVTLSGANSFLPQMNVFLGAVAIEDVNNVTIRVVTEWESTATGAGIEGFVTASTSAYGTSGTLRFDLVTIEGTPATGNAPPTISAISNQVIRIDTPTPELAFAIGDAETPVDELQVTAASSDETVVASDSIVVSGTGSNRTVQVFPNFGQTGAATITLTVMDGGGKIAATRFLVTVLPENTPPTISRIAPAHTRAGEVSAPIGFVIGDAESSPDDLELSGGSSNPDLLPPENIVFEGSGPNRTVTLLPLAGQCGVAVVNVTVSDPSSETTNTSFALLVVDTPGVVLCDSFTYGDGPIIRVSGGLWRNHSGTIGQMLTGSGRLSVLSSQGEDVNAPLLGAPYVSGSGARLYAKFTLNLSTLPTTEYGNYFAHFKDDSAAGFTTRIFAQTRDAEPGKYRLAIANRTSNATNATQLHLDLGTDVDYLVVTRYDTRTGLSTLWVNPEAETDPGVSGADEASNLTVSTYAFRESDSFGQMNIDDLKVATSFGELLGYPILEIERTDTGIAVSWDAIAGADFRLQGSPSLGSSADWRDETAVPQLEQGRMVVRYSMAAGSRFFRLARSLAASQ